MMATTKGGGGGCCEGGAGNCCSSSKKQAAAPTGGTVLVAATTTATTAMNQPTDDHHAHHQQQDIGGGDDDNNGCSLCLAVVRENGTDVVIFDASGIPRTFRYQKNSNSSDTKSSINQKQQDTEELCFESHGNDNIDDLLTPCFDEDGNHGVPEESCFCGVDTPHLHAHVRNPRTCGGSNNDDDDGKNNKKKSSMEDSIGLLASQILHPTTEEEEEVPTIATDGNGIDGAGHHLHMPVSDRLPKECNSQQAEQHYANISESSDLPLRHRRGNRFVHKVQHDDHVDYLVHNPDLDHLHLQHVNCNKCGKNDIHGKFHGIGKRHLSSSRGGTKNNKNLQLHFFAVAPRPFKILDVWKDLFEINSDRVHAGTHVVVGGGSVMEDNASASIPAAGSSGHPVAAVASSAAQVMPESKHITATRRPSSAKEAAAAASAMAMAELTTTAVAAATVRSTIKCKQICCAAEIPMIHKVLDGISGISKVRINVPLKQVLIDHDPSIVDAPSLVDYLFDFGPQLVRDGGAAAASTAAATTTNALARTQFHVANICCASEIPAIMKILEPLPYVENVSINTTTKKVYVDHREDKAQDMCTELVQQGFQARLLVDGHEQLQHQQHSPFVTSILSMVVDDGFCNKVDTTTLTTFLQTFVDQSQLEKFVVDTTTQSISVTHNPFSITASQMAQLVSERTQLEATVQVDGADPDIWKYPEILQQRGEIVNDDDDDRLGLTGEERIAFPRPTVIASGILWVVSMLSLIGGNWQHLKWVALVSVAFGIPPIAFKAWRTLRRYQFDTNCLMLFASVGAIALQDFTEAAAVVFLFALSEWLELRATSRARHALASIVQLRPEKAHLIHPMTHEILAVQASAVPVGATVSVRTGDKIPCDGNVMEGTSTVDEASLTGESRPIRKGPNDKVSGGTVNSGTSPLTVKTTATSENSAVSRLIRLVEEAQANRSETEKLVDRFAQFYTPVVVLAAILMCSIPWAFGSATGRQWTHNGLILIVVACPCSLIISTPVSYVAGLAATAQKGILIKGGAYLESLAAAKTVCFDKTGTLTNGEFALLHLSEWTRNMSRAEVFQYLSLMEERASHPVAQAILTAAMNEKVVLPKKMVLQKHMILNGEGVVGVIDGLEVYVGNERLFERLGLFHSVDQQLRDEVEEWKTLGGTVGFMSIAGHGIVCAYCAADGVRSESAAVVARLKKKGLQVVMLTGDNKDAADAIGKQVGLRPDEIKSRLLPEEKLHYVENLSIASTNGSVICNPCTRKELVIMCGDGVNDAPALAAAHIGLAMGEGAALAMETADVTLLDSNLEKIEYSINMGKRVRNKIIQNVVFSVVVKFIVLAFALAGKTELWAAIATDVGAMLLVTLNAMLLLPKRQTVAGLEDLRGDVEEGENKHRVGFARQGSGKTDDDAASEECPDTKSDTSRARKKGCCQSPEPVPATSQCEKRCCDSTASVEKPCTDSCRVSKVAQEGYNASCCDSTKKTTDAKRMSKTASSKCCGSSSKTTDAKCRKGCCESSQAAHEPSTNSRDSSSKTTDAKCQKGCCDSSQAASEPDTTSCDSSKKPKDAKCHRGCCESKQESEGRSTKGSASTEKSTDTNCRKGCCESKQAAKESSSSCCVSSGKTSKECCESKQAPDKRDAKCTDSAECSKGCCKSKQAPEEHVAQSYDNDEAVERSLGCCGTYVNSHSH